jgi:transketolase
MAAGVGHIASALSVVEIVAALFSGVLRGLGSAAPNRDRFLLSKGHAALALYAVLHLRGILAAQDLATYCADGTLLGVHPDHRVPGIDFSTGSLGHGLSVGAGAALGARLRRWPSRAFVLLSDAELNEGSTWEAAMFAGHHHLENLIAIVDANGQQALGKTSDILDLEPLEDKWRAFGWYVLDVDGHDLRRLRDALEQEPAGRPRCIIARTLAGKGVPFMERRVEWHYQPMNQEQYRSALEAVSRDK